MSRCLTSCGGRLEGERKKRCEMIRLRSAVCVCISPQAVATVISFIDPATDYQPDEPSLRLEQREGKDKPA